MPFAILRFKKCKSGGVSAAYVHNERKKEEYKSNPDINPYETPDNYHLVQPKQTYIREVKRMIAAAGCKTRRNSTVMVETLITASPEFMQSLAVEEQFDYFNRASGFMVGKIGKENIISAVVHMDERTPHMHLVFCPIVEGKRLSAKAILGNQAQLSKWQDNHHKHMSARWPELERGISAQITKRKHIPPSLFKLAERLDKQVGEIEAALVNINPINAKRQREKALELLEKWLPQAERFTSQIKTVDGHIQALERAEEETQGRIAAVAVQAKERITAAQNQVSDMDKLLADKDGELQKAQYQARELASRLRIQKALLDRVPKDVLEKYKVRSLSDERNH